MLPAKWAICLFFHNVRRMISQFPAFSVGNGDNDTSRGIVRKALALDESRT
jgi:hypothetical protein